MGHILDEVEDRAAASDEDLGLVIDVEDSVSTLTSLSVITSPPLSPSGSDFLRGEIHLDSDESLVDSDAPSQGDSTIWDLARNVNPATLTNALLEFEALLATGSDNAFKDFLSFQDPGDLSTSSSFHLDVSPGQPNQDDVSCRMVDVANCELTFIVPLLFHLKKCNQPRKNQEVEKVKISFPDIRGPQCSPPQNFLFPPPQSLPSDFSTLFGDEGELTGLLNSSGRFYDTTETFDPTSFLDQTACDGPT